MLLIPYRTKNPPQQFPYLTVGLIIVNSLVFALTSNHFLSVQRHVVEDWALSHNTWSSVRLVTAMFLHGSLFHLAGNMLFLWVFGSAVEGRLGVVKFGALYLGAGVMGSLSHEMIVGVTRPELFGMGASAAIMGLVGAYLFMFPFATICVVWAYGFFFLLRFRLMDWQARWVIAYYVLFDLASGYLFQGADGVAHFAHLGGVGAGYFFVVLINAQRDSSGYSKAQAVRTNVRGDYGRLDVHELRSLMENDGENLPLIMTYCQKTSAMCNLVGDKLCLEAMRQHSHLLATRGDAVLLARMVLTTVSEAAPLPVTFYLCLGARMEAMGADDVALRLYRRVYEGDPKSPAAEMAMYRWGGLLERAGDRSGAAVVYLKMLRVFPMGPMSLQAQAAVARCGSTCLKVPAVDRQAEMAA